MAQKALALDPSLAEAVASMGFVHFSYDWDWKAADSAFAKALSLDSRYAQARIFRVWYLIAVGDTAEAIREGQRAVDDDPLWLLTRTRLGNAYFFARQYVRAIEEFRKVLTLNPDYGFAQFWQAYAFSQAGMHDSAIVWAQKSGFSYRGLGIAAPGTTYALAGRRSDALKSLQDLKVELRDHYISPEAVARVFAALGEPDSAFAWLDRAYLDRTWSLIWVRSEPIYDKLHSDPRWAGLLRKIRFP